MNFRRNQEAALRFAERRRREDEAPRLLTSCPTLESLRLTFREMREGGTMTDTAHVRQVVVERAPALFDVPCRDTSCRDGGHELTTRILSSLRSKLEHFTGEDACRGYVGSAPCARVLQFEGTATYSR